MLQISCEESLVLAVVHIIIIITVYTVKVIILVVA